MTPRPPSFPLIVDANIILSVALGTRSRPVFEAVHGEHVLLTSATARAEVLRRAASLGDDAPETVGIAKMLLELVAVVDDSVYADRLEPAGETLRLAVASRNGSRKDAHVLALAWTLDADIWSHDRDFAGTGWPSWSNANLRARLGPSPAARDANPRPLGA